VALWNKVKTELDRAGRAAQQALDEGRLRLDVHRARQTADGFAQRLGYAYYRARTDGHELDPAEYTRLSGNLAGAEGEVTRLEALLAEATASRGKRPESGDASGGRGGAT
jgi:hypothetical protein